MLITNLLYMYGLWLFAAAMFSWLASILYRLSRNTFGPVPDAPAEPISVPVAADVNLPPRPTRKPRVPLTRAA